MIQEPCWPLRFSHQQLPVGYFADPTLAEQPLFARALDGEAVAQLWQAPQGFVVPGSYRKFAELPAVSEQFAGQGWPVWQRRSGGGLVPQGPGIVNLSLAWPVYHSLGEAAEPIYLSSAACCSARWRPLAWPATAGRLAVHFAMVAIIWPAARARRCEK